MTPPVPHHVPAVMPPARKFVRLGVISSIQQPSFAAKLPLAALPPSEEEPANAIGKRRSARAGLENWVGRLLDIHSFLGVLSYRLPLLFFILH